MDPSVHSNAIRKDPKSLAQVWTCSSQRLCRKPSSGYCSSMARIEVVQAQEVNEALLFFS
jgi:hypothetical protein